MTLVSTNLCQRIKPIIFIKIALSLVFQHPTVHEGVKLVAINFVIKFGSCITQHNTKFKLGWKFTISEIFVC